MPKLTVKWAFVLVFALIVAGCGSSGAVKADQGAPARQRPPAPAVVPGFRVVSRNIKLPPSCSQQAVKKMVVGLLRDFDAGSSAPLASAFVASAVFAPYNGTALAPSGTGSRAIARFVSARHAAGDVWTGIALIPPTSSDGKLAIYGLSLEVTLKGRLFKKRGAKIVVKCDTGRIRAWVGPVIPRITDKEPS